MKIAIFAFSTKGCSIAKTLEENYQGANVYTIERLAKEYSFLPIEKGITVAVGQCFDQVDALVFVGACGIAVRAIAPYLKSKVSDPAVVVIDDHAKHAISLLSGHLGGANELTQKIANLLGADPVITTATDVSGKFSVDDFARKHGCILDNLGLAKEISAEILNRNLPFQSDFPTPNPLPEGLQGSGEGELGIYLTVHKRRPFGKTLRLIAKRLHVGIGCRKGTSLETIQEVLEEVFFQYELEPKAIKCFASIDLKKEEQGILELSKQYQVPFVCYSTNELQDAKGEFTSSSFVASITGVDNVCERAAVLSSGNSELLVKKKSKNGVTIAVSKEEFLW